MTSRSDAGCVRGCVEPGRHWALCAWYGVEESTPAEKLPDGPECHGCVPAECRDGSMVCDRCFGRMRGLLKDATDLLGRMTSLAQHGKAVVYQPVKRSGSAPTSPEQVDADLADALIQLRAAFRTWGTAADLIEQLPEISNHRDQVVALSAWVLDVHTPDEHGNRLWSLADATAKWGTERRDRHVYPTEPDADGVVGRSPVREWFDRLLTVQQAAKRVERSQRTVQRWIKNGELEVKMRVRQPDGTVLLGISTEQLDDVAESNRPGRPAKAADHDTPEPAMRQ